MAIKVFTLRQFKGGTVEQAHKLLEQLRAAGTFRPGFVSGQTLVSTDDANRWLVISTWTDVKGWKAWRASEKRKEISQQIGELLESPEHVEIFQVARKETEGVDMA